MLPAIITCAYLLFLAIGSFRRQKKQESANSYLLAGRKLTLIPFMATMVTTAYGWILGIGEMYYHYGVSAWLLLSLPYTGFSLLMAFFFAKKIHAQQMHSIPELLAKHYGKQVARFAAVFVLLLISPAMYVLMTGQILASVFPLPIWACLIVALFFSSVYLYKGGFEVLAKKDSQKFLLMFGGFAVVLAYLYSQHGSITQLQLPETKLQFRFGTHAWDILTWFLLATMVFADPGYHQRIYSASSIRVARNGLLLSAFFWTLFDFIAASIALYGIVVVPEAAGSQSIFLRIGEQLPSWLHALFILGLLATVMSTADSFLFLSAQTLMIDLFGQEKDTGKTMRKGLLLVSVLTFLLLIPYQDKSAIDLFYDLTPLICSVLVVPVVCAFFGVRFRPVQILVQMVVSLLACFLWLMLPEEITLGLKPVILGVPVSLLMAVGFWLFNVSRRIRGKGAETTRKNKGNTMEPK